MRTRRTPAAGFARRAIGLTAAVATLSGSVTGTSAGRAGELRVPAGAQDRQRAVASGSSGAGETEQAAGSPRTLHVGAGGEFRTIAGALSAAAPGDTIDIAPGTYRERVTVTVPVVLRGRTGAVVDGGGEGTVITVQAPATVSGLTIRGSGTDQAREDAAILVSAVDGVRIEDNRMHDVLFGVYLKESDGARVRNNVIEGKDLPVPRRGDGIRLWYCDGGVVEGNRLRSTRDLVIWFTRRLTVRDNVVADGRYGLHYMYSDDNLFTGNLFVRNDVGAFLMYSARIELRNNRFLDASGGSGIGLGLKDADDVVATDNVFVGNRVGVFLDNSPNRIDGRNRFDSNLVARNGTGVVLLPSVRGNVFTDNDFLYNEIPVSVSGGGDARANAWSGNHWGDYVGFDRDGDGAGDSPFRHDRLADDLFARYPELVFYRHSPAVTALDLLSRLFPLLRPTAVVIDSIPQMRLRSSPARQAGQLPRRRHAGAALGFWTLSIGLAWLMARGVRRPRRAG